MEYDVMRPLTQTELKKLFHYDPKTGVFTRLVKTANRTHVGDKIPGTQGGIRIHSQIYQTRHLAWLYVHGDWPPIRLSRTGNARLTDLEPSVLKHTEEHKEHMRQVMTGRVISTETRHKMSVARTGTKVPDHLLWKWSECKRGELNGMYGKHHSEYTKSLVTTPPIKRFLAHVPHRPKFPKEACWVWDGGTIDGQEDSHGVFRGTPGTSMYTAQRFAWEVVHGPIPKGMWVCHKCDNPPCVRPSHLFLGTPLDNTRDMIAKERGRWQRNAPHKQVAR